MKIEFWHNPRCSKSRQALKLLEERGVEPTIVRYLEEPPTQKRLREVLQMLGVGPDGLLRKKEKAYKELGLGEAGDAEKIRAMTRHPILIERPVAIRGRRAVIGRPPERVLELLG